MPIKAKKSYRRKFTASLPNTWVHVSTVVFWVGENSDIPNIKGYRTDVFNALKDLSVPVLRWPGGCFADEYHWMDGIGPKENRPKMVNNNWGGTIEDNSFGTHEFF